MGQTNIPADNDIGHASGRAFRRRVFTPSACTPRAFMQSVCTPRAFSAGPSRFKSRDFLSSMPLRPPYSTPHPH
jgi:hypothetical protein